MNRAVPGILLLVLLLGAVVILTDDSSTDASLDSDSPISTESEYEAPQVDRASSNVRSDSASNERRVETNSAGLRRIFVVDASGQPVPGALLAAYVVEAGDHLAEFVEEKLAQFDQIVIDDYVRVGERHYADDTGLVELSTSGFGYAVAEFEGSQGKLALEAVADKGRVYELNLEIREVPRKVVRVEDHQGNAVPDVGVSLRWVRTDTLRQFEHRGTRESRFGDQLATRQTDESGMAWLPASASANRAKRIEEQLDNHTALVTVDLPFGTLVHQEVELGVVDELSLRLPELGQVEVTLVGYPDNSTAWIFESKPQSFSGGRGPAHADPGDAPLHYRFVPLDMPMEARIYRTVERVVGGKTKSVERSTRFPKPKFAGPKSADETVRVEFKLAESGAIRGRLLNSQGKALQQFEEHKDWVQLTAYLKGGSGDYRDFHLERLQDGYFYAYFDRTGAWTEATHTLADFDRLKFVYQREGRKSDPIEQKRHLWAELPVDLSESEAGIDLGEIQLGQEGGVALQVLALDEVGEPVQFASVQIERESISEGSVQWERVRSSSSPPLTGAHGRAFILDGLWERKLQNGEPTGNWRAIVRANGYVKALAECGPAQREVTVQLEPERFIEGRMIIPEGLGDCAVLAYPWRPELGGYDTEHSIRASPSRIRVENRKSEDDGATHRYSLRRIGGVKHRVVFLVNSYQEPVLEIFDVHPDDSSALAEVVDLHNHLQMIDIEFRSPEEELLTREAENDGLRCFLKTAEGASFRMKPLRWVGTQASWYAPASIKGTLLFVMNGMQSVAVETKGQSNQVIRFSERHETKFAVEGTSFLSESESLRLEFTAYGGKHLMVEPRSQVLEAGSTSEVFFRFSEAGSYRLTWVVTNKDGVRLSVESERMKFTKAQLNSTEPIVLSMPENLVQRNED